MVVDLKQNCLDNDKHKKQDSPKISVIVPVYKVDKYLTQCIESILHQTMKELEIIIVDEGDIDRCREIIDYYEKADPRIIAPHKKNGGYGASCNLGIRMARGEFISIIESDDFIEPEMYEEMYAYAKELGADVVKTPYYEYAMGKKQVCSYRQRMAEALPKNRCFSSKCYGQLFEIHASLWSGIYRTEYIKNNNIYFIEAKGAAYVDVGFRIDTLIHSNKIAWLDKPYYNYRLDNETSSTNTFNMKSMLQRWREIHEREGEFQIDYDKYYGRHLIIDEYLNSLGYLHNRNITEDEKKDILYNFCFIKDELIKTSDVLSEKQKNEIFNFKKSPKLFTIKMNIHRFFKIQIFRFKSFTDRYSNATLLFYCFVGFVTSHFLNDGILTGNMLSASMMYIFKIAEMIFLVGVSLVMLCKMLHIIIRIVLDKHVGNLP